MKRVLVVAVARRFVALLSTFSLALLASLAASPATFAQGKEVEIYVGQYVPDPSVLDSDLSFGVRFLRGGPGPLKFGTEVSYIQTDGEVTSGLQTGTVDWDSFCVDFVADYSFAPGKKFETVLTLGTGFAYESAEASVSGPIAEIDVEDFDDVTYTIQGGIGFKIAFGKAFFLRPAARLRWFPDRDQSDLDTEYLVGFGRRW
ncbi:MAG TPA: outer membrane beta-barrel protein [Candidatus Cryosericum sp.]|nr:outer membrane beta-barrel protein [Candidatus Cryosericum sp.]